MISYDRHEIKKKLQYKTVLVLSQIMTVMRIQIVQVDIVNDMGRVANGLPRFVKDVKVPAAENINEAIRGIVMFYYCTSY